MLSYTGARNLYGSLTNNTTAANLTLGDTLINNYMRLTISGFDWDFLEQTATDSTVASTQFYQLPKDVNRIISVTVTSGSTVWTPTEIPNKIMWDRLNQNTSVTSNYPQYFYISNKAGTLAGSQLGFWPTPSTSSLTITYTYKRRVKDLTIADYTTGTISAVSSTSVTGSGTSWTAQMEERFIQITDSNTANTGDGYWYEILTVNSATSITLVKAYQGTAIVAGSAAYTIGQISILPETYQILPVYGAVATYWEKEGVLDSANHYKEMYNDLLAEMRAEHGSKTTNLGINIGMADLAQINPNLTISL